MSLEDPKIAFSTRKLLIEAAFAGGRPNHRFWLLVINIIASVVLFIGIFLYLNIIWGILATVLAIIIMYRLQIDKLWLRLIAWRFQK